MGPLPLGKVVATPGAIKLIRERGEHPLDYLARHATGDWGDLDDQDRVENERSLKYGWRIVSSYPIGQQCIWIITEADRSVTTILLPEEY
jgi:hypothetical protein